MPSGSLTLADYPTEWVALACRRCDRRGRLRRARLLETHGADVALPDLRHRLAADCPHWGESGTTCGVYYVDLAPPPG